jgi:hypothetical protein
LQDLSPKTWPSLPEFRIEDSHRLVSVCVKAVGQASFDYSFNSSTPLKIHRASELDSCQNGLRDDANDRTAQSFPA